MNDTEQIVVAMSGGVDSSTAAALLLQQGHRVAGMTMLLPRFDADGAELATVPGASGDARRVADALGIELAVVDFRERFHETVLDYFEASYAAGRTPNPCARCNEWMKFGALLQAALETGADAMATGHYVRRVRLPEAGRWGLAASPADNDQSYFLAGLTQEQLAAARFPLGGMHKDEVRAVARELGLPVHDRGDSQDLCFLPSGGYRAFLRRRCPDAFRPGPLRHARGEQVGRHDGLAAYTIGQRRGLGVAWREPLYVLGLQPEDNAVLVGERDRLARRALDVEDVNWIVRAPAEPVRATVKIRYNHRGAPATVIPRGAAHARVQFDAAVDAPCPGQAAVFYRGDLVLGGGTIADTDATEGDDE